MKKNLIFVALGTMMLSSCVQDEGLVNDVSSSPKEITFQTVVAKQSSRALINGSEYKSTDPSFGAWARYNPDGNTVGTMAFIENDKVEYLTEGSVGYWGIDKETHGTHYWPAKGSLTFFAYSPFYYQEGNFNDQPIATIASSPQAGQHGVYFPNYDVDMHQETDLMVADVKVGLTAHVTHGEAGNPSAYTGVPTIFRHKLAVLTAFRLSTSDDYNGNFVAGDPNGNGPWNTGAETGDMRFYIKKITLKNIKSKGTYKGETYRANGDKIIDEWLAPTDAQKENDYVWFEDTTGVEFGYELSKSLQISYVTQGSEVPLKDPTIKNTKTNSENYSWYLLVLPQEFETGKQQLEVTYFIKTYNEPASTPTTYAAAEACWQPNDPVTKTIDLVKVHPEGKQAWKMNEKITYNLKFSTSEIRWAPHIQTWEDAFPGGYVVDF